MPKRHSASNNSDPSVSSPSTWVVDQVEEDVASVEIDGRATTVPVWMLPRGVAEGTVLRVTMVPDAAEAARRLERSRQQVATKSKNDPGGDVVL